MKTMKYPNQFYGHDFIQLNLKHTKHAADDDVATLNNWNNYRYTDRRAIDLIRYSNDCDRLFSDSPDGYDIEQFKKWACSLGYFRGYTPSHLADEADNWA